MDHRALSDHWRSHETMSPLDFGAQVFKRPLRIKLANPEPRKYEPTESQERCVKKLTFLNVSFRLL